MLHQLRSSPHAARPILLAITLTPLFLIACGGDASDLDVAVADVDQETSFTVTNDEYADFSPPRDSLLSEDQVVAYLRTSLLQFDLIREESGRLRENVATIEQREQSGGALSQLQNLVTAGRTLFQTADLIGGSYVRSARALDYNPAEMEWVRDRFVEVSGYLFMAPMFEQARESASGLREQAEQLRAGPSGNDPNMQVQINGLLAAAADMESNSAADTPRAIQNNVEVLRRARSSVSDEMWTAIGIAGGASGLIAIAGWDDPKNPETNQYLNQLRQLYQDALDDRVSAVPTRLR